MELESDDVFQVQAGDRYGFTWLNYGVIDFDRALTDNFCEGPVKQDVGSTVNLVENRHGRREYSIRMLLSTCQKPTVKSLFRLVDPYILQTQKQRHFDSF